VGGIINLVFDDISESQERIDTALRLKSNPDQFETMVEKLACSSGDKLSARGKTKARISARKEIRREISEALNS